MTRLLIGYLLLLFEFQLLKADCVVPSETIANGTKINQLSEKNLCPGDLIFEDNFSHFDLAVWQHEITLAGGGNGEFQYYSNNKSNSYVQDGNLHIKPTYLTDDYGEDFLYSGVLDVNAKICTNSNNYGCSRTGSPTNILNPIKSARIRTMESFSFRYGTVIVRAKLPAGDWLWPAIWLMPRDNAYGYWPASGEIDLIESRGNRNLVNTAGINVGTQQVTSGLHWGPSFNHNQYFRTHFAKNNVTGYNSDFHTYKLVWNSSGLTYYVDDERVGSVVPPQGGFWELGELGKSGLPNPWKAGSKMAPFDQQFYLIINLAVGGTNYYFDDSSNNPGGKPWVNTSPTAMTDFWKGKSQWEPSWNLKSDDAHLVVDYVRVIGLNEEQIQKAIQSNGAFVIKAGEMQQIINHSVINYKAFFRWLYASIMHLTDEAIPSDIQKMTQQDLACITEFLQNFDNYGQSDKKENAPKFIMERLGQYLVDDNLTIKPDMSGNDWTQFLEENECLKDNPNILTHYGDKSLIQVFNELKSNVEKVFESPLIAIEKAVVPVNCFSSFNFGIHKMIVSSINVSNDMLLLAILKPSKSVYLFQIQFDDNGKCQARCGNFFINQERSSEEELEEPFGIVDTKFYSANILSILLQETSNSRRGGIFQLPMTAALEQLKEVDLSSSFLEENIPNINAWHFSQKHYKNVEMPVSQFSVSGTRRVSIVLAENKRKVKLFEMECEEDEEEEADMSSFVKDEQYSL